MSIFTHSSHDIPLFSVTTPYALGVLRTHASTGWTSRRIFPAALAAALLLLPYLTILQPWMGPRLPMVPPKTVQDNQPAHRAASSVFSLFDHVSHLAFPSCSSPPPLYLTSPHPRPCQILSDPTAPLRCFLCRRSMHASCRADTSSVFLSFVASSAKLTCMSNAVKRSTRQDKMHNMSRWTPCPSVLLSRI